MAVLSRWAAQPGLGCAQPTSGTLLDEAAESARNVRLAADGNIEVALRYAIRNDVKHSLFGQPCVLPLKAVTIFYTISSLAGVTSIESILKELTHL